MDAVDRIGSAFLRAIFSRMKELGVNQSELARRMKVSRPYITKVMQGDVNFTFARALQPRKFRQILRMRSICVPSLETKGQMSFVDCLWSDALIDVLTVALA